LAGVCLTAGNATAQNRIFDSRLMAPFVPTPELVVQRMLELAELKSTDTLYDLGSGDGRILFTAAQSFEASAVGIEISETLVTQTRAQAEALGLSEKVTVLKEDLLQADLSEATVVTVYLLSSSNEQLRPKLEKELQPGTRVISHDFQFKSWTPTATEEVAGSGRTHRIYLYKMGATSN
jgi:16S rRNA A1518/A1519 N6-dimethyltransferase RsmA/KsgA/DIM1 with predicted DNA glycosylase/AP lyase activity